MSKNKQTVFTGAAVAIVTPFKNDKLDYDALGKIIDDQIERGTDAIVVCGTTGEASTLTDEEHVEAIDYTVKHVNKRVPVIAGAGSNDTRYAIWLSREACRAGADALLQVTPYYNKATPKGLIKHFSAIADATDIPNILYNVPSRTGCSITLPVYKELAKHPNIVATKEASGNLELVKQIISECGDDLDVYSGNDDQIYDMLSLGAKGVISVLSNVMPTEAHDICKLYFEGKVNESKALQEKLLELVNNLFIEVNPIPVKTAMSLLGWCSEEMRLPLCEMEDAHLATLKASMKKYGLMR